MDDVARNPAARTRCSSLADSPPTTPCSGASRGMGKSSLVKAVHAHINALKEPGLKRLILIEIRARGHRGPAAADAHDLRARTRRFIVFCDDLCFDKDETSYKSLKTILDGGLEGRPENVLFYATSNRRHLMPRDMVENERSTAITPGEAVEEKVSLSRPLRPLVGLPQLRPADLPFDDPRLLRRIWPGDRRRDAAGPCRRVVDDARRPLGPRRHPVRPGPGGGTGQGDLSLLLRSGLLLPLREKVSTAGNYPRGEYEFDA
ncbi:MAG: DUF815 domain-containing protein [Rubrivivax sp.]